MLNLLLNKLLHEFAPRANIKKLFTANKISVNDKKKIEEFSIQYAVQPMFNTWKSRKHACALIRAREKQQKKIQS